MRFVECDIAEIKRAYKKTKILKILDDFQKSEFECAKLEDWKYYSATGGAASINRSIKRYGFAGINAIVRQGQIYLVREKS